MASRVLVIDDSAMMVELVSQALTAAGLSVEAASDLAQLDARLAGQPFDLVLVDVNMPEMYGDDVVEFLRNQRQVTAKLYLYSDISEAELSAKAAASGADGYVTKSQGVEATVEAIQHALEAQPLKRQRVLVVDDSEHVTKLIEVELVARGHEVIVANNADDATKLILKKKTRPDVVLLDVQMPGVNGEELCRFIKSNSLFAGIQVILCSGQDESELQRIVQTAGADGYIRKDSLIARELLEIIG